MQGECVFKLQILTKHFAIYQLNSVNRGELKLITIGATNATASSFAEQPSLLLFD